METQARKQSPNQSSASRRMLSPDSQSQERDRLETSCPLEFVNMKLWGRLCSQIARLGHDSRLLTPPTIHFCHRKILKSAGYPPLIMVRFERREMLPSTGTSDTHERLRKSVSQLRKIVTSGFWGLEAWNDGRNLRTVSERQFWEYIQLFMGTLILLRDFDIIFIEAFHIPVQEIDRKVAAYFMYVLGLTLHTWFLDLLPRLRMLTRLETAGQEGMHPSVVLYGLRALIETLKYTRTINWKLDPHPESQTFSELQYHVKDQARDALRWVERLWRWLSVFYRSGPTKIRLLRETPKFFTYAFDLPKKVTTHHLVIRVVTTITQTSGQDITPCLKPRRHRLVDLWTDFPLFNDSIAYNATFDVAACIDRDGPTSQSDIQQQTRQRQESQARSLMAARRMPEPAWFLSPPFETTDTISASD